MAISAEIYPSMVRGTGAGISASFGKAGATVGAPPHGEAFSSFPIGDNE